MPKLLNRRFHPLFGFYLEGIVPRLHLFEIIFMCIGTSFLIIGIRKNWDQWREHETANSTLHYLRLTLWIGYGCHIIISLTLAVVLRRACLSKRPEILRVWICCTILSVLFALGSMFTNMYFFRKFLPHVLSVVSMYGGLKFYLCYIVYYYLKDMEVDNHMASAIRILTDSELAEFENGKTEPRDRFDYSTKNLIDQVQYQRYKREDFEIPMDRLEIDVCSPLGKGEYGTVYKAILKSKLEENNILAVAVKTIDPGTANIVCFKALLAELKVMTNLGHHSNIVNLIGANTYKIRQRDLKIIMELCALGSMLTFLRGSRGLFHNLVRNGELSTPKNEFQVPECLDLISTKDLVRWSHEIALGMEFLASKKVIHGDLAIRNILLTDKKIAKITDFGLARQLYQYSVYVKRQNTPVPWRWLAIESLTDMNFSSLSDVWSYGITLWEMYTLGEVPYQGYNFTFEFLQNLKNGLRPSPPSFAPTFIWDLMTQCWQMESKSRPSFTEIGQIIQKDFSLA